MKVPITGNREIDATTVRAAVLADKTARCIREHISESAGDNQARATAWVRRQRARLTRGAMQVIQLVRDRLATDRP
jgi:hypothetical protein